MMCKECTGGVCKEGDCSHGACGACGKKCWSAKIAKILLIIGGLNWGLIGLGGFLGGNWNVVHMILGGAPAVEWIVYLLVGIAAIVKIFGCRCHKCKEEMPMPMGGGQM